MHLSHESELSMSMTEEEMIAAHGRGFYGLKNIVQPGDRVTELEQEDEFDPFWSSKKKKIRSLALKYSGLEENSRDSSFNESDVSFDGDSSINDKESSPSSESSSSNKSSSSHESSVELPWDVPATQSQARAIRAK